MSSVNVLAREVAAKIVFYGPGLSGKTTTLKKIYESVRPTNRGEMMSLATEGDRTLFFDFLPVKVERVGDCAVRLALYTVPGQVFYNATRKLVLQGADGVVFVADSQREAMDQNRESLLNLQENLAEQGIRLDRFPVAFQWNKRDIPGCVPVQVLSAELNPRNAPAFETTAMNGKGVLEALKAITRLVIKDLREKKVVPSPRAEPSAPAMSLSMTRGQRAGGIEDQVLEQLNRNPHAGPQPVLNPAGGPGGARPRGVGPLSALAPADLLDYARAADLAFATGDFDGCVRACHEAVRRTLAYAGEHTLPSQAFLLRVDGGDLLRLQQLAGLEQLGVEDASFALFVALQSFWRLIASGIGR